MLVNDSWRETFPVPLLPILRHMEPSGHSGLSQLRKWPTLRFAISLIVLASLIVNVAARFIPPERVAFRAWDAASLYATSEGHFAPNFHYANDRTLETWRNSEIFLPSADITGKCSRQMNLAFAILQVMAPADHRLSSWSVIHLPSDAVSQIRIP